MPVLAAFFLVASGVMAGGASLVPVADTYVRSNMATTAYGTQTTMQGNNNNGVRVMLLRFDLSTFTGPISHLHLDITASMGTAGNTYQVFGLTSGEGWVENTVTWATAPGVKQSFTGAAGVQADFLDSTSLYGAGKVLATFNSVANGVVTAFDVTSGPLLDFVNADADKVVTFVLAEADPVDVGGDIFYTRESTTGPPTLTVGNNPPVANLRVVLVGGQSNADGRADGSTLPAYLQAAQADVPFYYYTYGAAANADGTLGTLTTLRPGATQMPSGGFGPEVSLGYNLAPVIESQPGTALAIIKYAKGGSNLYSDWKADGTASSTADGQFYQTFQQVVHNGLTRLRAANPDATVSLAGMVWVQGESDIDGGSSTSSAYGANLTQFIADVRATFCPTLPFFFSQISSNQTYYSLPSDSSYSNYLILRGQQAQVAANVTNTYLINADGAAFTVNSDNLHFSTAGQQALGAAFANSMAGVLKLQTTTQQQGGNLLLQWNAVPGKSYLVDTSNDLLMWQSQNVGAVSSFSDPITASERFYRVSEINDTVSGN